MIPAMTTGITDFMMNSGFMTAIADMPQPDLAVPYAAPSAENTMAAVAPITPKKALYAGHLSEKISTPSKKTGSKFSYCLNEKFVIIID
ncbi:hypothetical protein BpHYR1_043100 [Brachionus plicatilis]|uniref:Uncharacterized protein n=1 Tax=Brachionus plicatilis TaxID=10195 RepID=A0A3M7T1V8_BRAPC|nr:hypothetical protein BpHYR1_043100 [Brachionus plicatilis]